MAPWVETSDEDARFVDSDADKAVINDGGIFRRRANTNHHSNNKRQMQKRGYVSWIKKKRVSRKLQNVTSA
jgi:ribosomal protein L35